MTVDNTPKSPTSPTSAAAGAHPLDRRCSPQTPRLHLVTTFPLDSALGRRRRASRAIISSSPQTNPADTVSESGRDSMTTWSPPYPAPRPADYRAAIARISTPLVPLISVTTGLAHPHFPRSLLQFYLLTHDQLDSLARWYHQVEPAVEETWMYPAWIPPFTSSSSSSSSSEGTTAVTKTYREQPSASAYTPSRGFEHVTLETKRRRWGRFIGFQGCESPSQDVDGTMLAEKMERDWRNAIRRMRDVEVLREKEWTARW